MFALRSSFFLLSAIVLVAFIQTACASVFSQLQYIKIVSPTSGQDVKAGESLVVKYVMQPLVLDGVSSGKALSLNISLHSRTGNQKQQKLAIVHNSCPVTAQTNKYVTHTKTWSVPANLKPGSYAIDFEELVQFRRSQVTATETVKINIVD
ncbi:hypothetical protein J3Q64DRAFT_1832629 [Phycomyces blakesleeanus]|uniref:Phosphatidylglycerol/phosphatidylinositol transfer protein n=2 Tax=Phycomyces blakesleeanus TaxID=4837 RepID=A0A162U3N6_PHYB8|nr:hypothetical protein PHYBLDRAFT_79218 [Phycomyces blakesleeanus NRRL 1555(-)]OAD72103.1 hypothetical protein PHYBLDRAFT_79218 [Phycomyces blakesleeanus NRRL 1555(-)]|eukprot:XP_018290143.1 hypothetical protein PHYBLDRAFT_79218 [Phycomyces blakesleeanus NRRL 1555(-)]